jgi:CheY-like chemotaxis protein
MSKRLHQVNRPSPANQTEAPAYLVLIAEDHEGSRLMLKIMLELRGIKVVEAVDGETAVKIALSEHPDLILMDLNLPQMDGISAMERIRESGELQNVPVVFVTGLSDDRFRNKLLNNDLLLKPISYSAFNRTLKRYLPDKVGEAPPHPACTF